MAVLAGVPGCADPDAVADRLLARWGTLPRLLEAPSARVVAVGGSRAAADALAAFRRAAAYVLRAEAAEQPMLADWRALLDYLRFEMAHAPVEQFRVLHLNTRNVLIRDELLWTGSIDEAPVHVREVIRSAMDFGSAALILVHNHPSGDPAPSRADVAVTRSVIEAGRALGIAVHDHLVIGARGHVSLRGRGLI